MVSWKMFGDIRVTWWATHDNQTTAVNTLQAFLSVVWSEVCSPHNSIFCVINPDILCYLTKLHKMKSTTYFSCQSCSCFHVVQLVFVKCDIARFWPQKLKFMGVFDSKATNIVNVEEFWVDIWSICYDSNAVRHNLLRVEIGKFPSTNPFEIRPLLNPALATDSTLKIVLWDFPISSEDRLLLLNDHPSGRGKRTQHE